VVVPGFVELKDWMFMAGVKYLRVTVFSAFPFPEITNSMGRIIDKLIIAQLVNIPHLLWNPKAHCSNQIQSMAGLFRGLLQFLGLFPCVLLTFSLHLGLRFKILFSMGPVFNCFNIS
jgi:hypothetical protein